MVRLLPALFFMLMMTTAQAEVIAITDSPRLYEDERLTLTVRVSPVAELDPNDVEALEQLFTIEQRYRQERRQNVNGQNTSFVDYQFRLSPKQRGELTIPSFQVNGQSSDPIRIEVLNTALRPDGLAEDAVIFSAELSQPTAYVDQSIRLTLSLAYNIQFRNGEVSAFDPEGFDVVLIDENRSTTQINGSTYNLYTRVIELTPQRPGLFTLPAVRFSAEYPNRTLGRYQRFSRSTDAINLQINAIPETYPDGAYWLPAQSLSLTGNLETQVTLERADHLDWQLQLQVRGLPAEKLPPIIEQIQDQLPKQIRLYRNPADIDNQTRRESLAVSFTEPGTYTLPAIQIPWWNLQTDSLAYAELPATTIEVLASTKPESPSTLTPEDSRADRALPEPANVPAEAQLSPSSIWPLLTLLAGSGWLGTLILWWRSSIRQKPEPAQALNAHQNDWLDSRETPSGWYQMLLKVKRQATPSTLTEDDEALLRQLEAYVLFGKGTAPDKKAVQAAFKRLNQELTMRSQKNREKRPGTLYPSG